MCRPVGYRKSKMDYLTKYGHLIHILQRGLPLRQTAAICGLSVNTIRKLRQIL